ncbi:alpha-glucoside-specific PTS transporter subunit IIBC [Borrelia sp. BU AG58]|uniref:alpha-glucoside-specific PTS transporter subunit IIBC n=1 Tax=Borrelia sp. BU AG58 TaxID=2887345 RepID=UPI001E4FAF1A|nr:alpha-glucoside-specific PTS transporter subunit IIBC [Borrelia sp. BU AG58]UER67601.1 alpha-glucoside-specific PTS transporter subunit IIBC [Borrelia sp. BU AG58]
MVQTMQKFGSAMVIPALFFALFGLVVGVSSVFLVGASPGVWRDFWWMVGEGGWTIFRQMPLLFAAALPISLAKKASARACIESFLAFLLFNYFIAAILSLYGQTFGVDYSMDPGGTSGLTMLANIKTLDTSIFGAITVSCIIIYLHNRYFDVRFSPYFQIFSGSNYIVALSFLTMLPLAVIFCIIWPKIQMGIAGLQGVMAYSGAFGVWLYTFLERVLIPFGFHHFIYQPFIFGPAVVDDGILKYWAEHIQEFSQSTIPLKDLFPGGGFALHGNSKVFGVLGLSLAMYYTAREDKRKALKGLLVPAALTSMINGITEPIEFTFLFAAPMLFVLHSVLAGCMSAIMYSFGLVGNMGTGIIDFALLNWIPMWKNHPEPYVAQLIIGSIFTAIYFYSFKYLILKFNFKTPGRWEDDTPVKLHTKKDYIGDQRRHQSLSIIHMLGGKANIEDISNCATRLRITVKDVNKVHPDESFKKYGVKGIFKTNNYFQIVIGLDVSILREEMESILNSKEEEV